LFCRKSSGRSPTGRSGYFASTSRVSSRVRKEFMKISGRREFVPRRAARTCSTMRSRKLFPSRTGSSDFAWSRPIEVPRPPLRLMIASLSKTFFASATSIFTSSRWVGSRYGEIVSSGIVPVTPSSS
jgi:hypothetical protein